MDPFDEYRDTAKGMPVPELISVLSAIYNELASDPVMCGPAMYMRQALIELDDLCSLARQVPLEQANSEDGGARDRRPKKGRGKAARKLDCEKDVNADSGACLAPLASLRPYSFLKQ